MSFLAKKILAALLLPLPLCILFCLIGLLFLIFTRLRKTGTTFVSIGVLILVVFSISPTATFLLNGLEKQYTPLMSPPRSVEKIVVLGGGVSGNKKYPANTCLNSASLSRLVEGIRLYRRLSKRNLNEQLILSGGRVFRSPSISGKMKNTAVILGVDPSSIYLENGSQDTYHEALYLKSQLGKRRFILVTSAYHMPRAMALFKAQGMHPIAAPTQFLAKRNRYSMSYFIPSTSNLVMSNIALHEYLGMAWHWISTIRG